MGREGSQGIVWEPVLTMPCPYTECTQVRGQEGVEGARVGVWREPHEPSHGLEDGATSNQLVQLMVLISV